MARACFEGMGDDRVLAEVEGLVRRSNEITAELLAYLAEVEERRLHVREGCPSLFAFCVERLHLSEGAAGKRIWAARTARRFPRVLEMIARGEIHLTAVHLLAPHLTEENHAELLGRARHRSKREIERLVAEAAPRPDAPARVVPLSNGRYEIRVTIDEETHGKLTELQDLLAHTTGRDPAAIVARAIDVLHKRTLARKAAVTGRPRAAKAAKKRARYIPAAVRREVWTREGGRCSFIDGKGRRCSARQGVEFHHLDNWGRGAEHAPARIELRCRAHNQYQAELDYGVELMARRRAERSRAREPRPPYAVCSPEGARGARVNA